MRSRRRDDRLSLRGVLVDHIDVIGKIRDDTLDRFRWSAVSNLSCAFRIHPSSRFKRRAFSGTVIDAQYQ